MITVKTERSVYIFDEAGRYCRMPKNEMPREFDERFQQMLSGGPMDDNVWNDLVKVEFTRHPLAKKEENDSLRVFYIGAKEGIVTTPITDSSIEDAKRLVESFQ